MCANMDSETSDNRQMHLTEKAFDYNDNSFELQKLEERANKAVEALEKESKLRVELESLNSKLLAEKTALLESLAGEKGSLGDFQERCAKLSAQKADLDNQLRVSNTLYYIITKRKKIRKIPVIWHFSKFYETIYNINSRLI